MVTVVQGVSTPPLPLQAKLGVSVNFGASLVPPGKEEGWDLLALGNPHYPATGPFCPVGTTHKS